MLKGTVLRENVYKNTSRFFLVNFAFTDHYRVHEARIIQEQINEYNFEELHHTHNSKNILDVSFLSQDDFENGMQLYFARLLKVFLFFFFF